MNGTQYLQVQQSPILPACFFIFFIFFINDAEVYESTPKTADALVQIALFLLRHCDLKEPRQESSAVILSVQEGGI